LRLLKAHDAAAKVGLSASRFDAAFKHNTGLIPADYHLRMHIAAMRQALTSDHQ
jgi:methylphosphotriester-DNA--protein-cysteine methyltransferase